MAKGKQRVAAPPSTDADGDGRGAGDVDVGKGKGGTEDAVPVTRAVHGQTGTQEPAWAFLACVAFAVAAFVCYTLTASHGMGGHDAGELVVTADAGGNAHPPGYPFLMMLFRGALRGLGALLPDSTPAWRCNVLNSFFSAVAAGVLLRVCLLVTKFNAAASLLATTFFAFSTLTWNYAHVAEVFALNNMMLALLALLVVRFAKAAVRGNVKQMLRLSYLGAFVSGLALTNQQTVVLFVVPIVLWVLYHLRDQLWRRPFSLTFLYVFLFGLGLVPYLYMPWAASSHPDHTWGEPDHWEGFWTQLLRSEYGTFKLSPLLHKPDPLWMFYAYYGWQLMCATLFIGPLAAFYAVVVMWRSGHESGGRGRSGKQQSKSAASDQAKDPHKTLLHLLLWPIFGSVVFFTLFFFSLANLPLNDDFMFAVQSRFWMQPNLFMAILIAIGLQAAFGLVEDRGRAKDTVRAVKMVALFAVVVIVAYNYRIVDQSDNDFFVRYAKECLRPLPKNSIVLIEADINYNSFRYVQYSLNYRPDLILVDQVLLPSGWYVRHLEHKYPKMKFPRDDESDPDVGMNLVDLLIANRKKHPNVFATDVRPVDREDFDKAYVLREFGLLKQVVRKENAVQTIGEEWKTVKNALMPLGTVFKWIPIDQRQYGSDTFEYWSLRKCASVVVKRVYYWLEHADSLLKDAPAEYVPMLESLLEHINGVLPIASETERTTMAAMIKTAGIVHQLLWESPPDEDEKRSGEQKEERIEHGARMVQSYRWFIENGAKYVPDSADEIEGMREFIVGVATEEYALLGDELRKWYSRLITE